MSSGTGRSDRRLLAPFLVVAGLLGLWASFELVLAKFATLDDADAVLGCDFSIVVQCGANLASDQGAAFGFPNPLLGLAGFVAPVAVGVALLAGARFARWFWLLFQLGVTGGMAFVLWLIGQSIYVLGTLCPWCMVVWAVMIPLFLALTLRNAAAGVFGDGLRRAGSYLLTWLVPLILTCYLIIALLAQLRLDVLRYL
ncbi:vitamin K epoxide reductase family protein [Ornithinimicrobium murale]|uniref:vitamin K epoxide reductase family protein n=1 Tax=Ornithinimicrobium murale TaxID=1050153 RepID=UPI000E0CFF59|nr:vitamin K epoxide reductase family protein [Ornithinimicrobium murale]